MNILSNAVKYTPEGGTIEISSGALEDRVWIRVQDSGIGIPEADLPRVFDRFYRVDRRAPAPPEGQDLAFPSPMRSWSGTAGKWSSRAGRARARPLP
jgi:signal transduction histidine kinase